MSNEWDILDVWDTGESAVALAAIKARNEAEAAQAATEALLPAERAARAAADAELRALISGSSGAYTLPPATAVSLGGVRVGAGLAIDGAGVLSVSGSGGGTTLDVYTKSEVDALLDQIRALIAGIGGGGAIPAGGASLITEGGQLLTSESGLIIITES